MDRFIRTFAYEPDDDLMLCRDNGVAYQWDRSNLCVYDEAYFDRCKSYEDQEIANKINAGRIALVDRHFGSGRIVDVGIGSGEFIKKRPNTFGHDVNPVAIEWLKRNDLWAERLLGFGAATFWDVLEHVEDPGQYLQQINLHCFVFVSIPIVYALGAIRLSKHYRPGEHLTYFTEEGFVAWMDLHGLMMLEHSTFEIDAGRESIHSFAFVRNRWPKCR